MPRASSTNNFVVHPSTTRSAIRGTLRAVSFVLSVFLCTSIIHARQVQLAQEGGGFQPRHIFVNGPGGDSINPYSGAAENVISIGPTLHAGGGLELGLTLHHSTRIWARWNDGFDRLKYMKRRGAFGVGWKLHMGRVYRSCRNGCFSNDWIYESPDGTPHPIGFGVSQYAGSPVYDGTVDGTFIRAEQYSSNPDDPNDTLSPSDPNFNSGTGGWRLYMGNGVVYILGRRLENTDSNHSETVDESEDFRGWYTTRIERWDTSGHVVGRIAVAYEASPKAHCMSQVDFFGPDNLTIPQRSITFANETHLNDVEIEGGYTTGISFPALNGQTPTTATYAFHYEGPLTLHFNPTASLPTHYDNQFLLDSIAFPSPDPNNPIPQMTFTYDQDPNHSGDLIERRLPTGAKVRYAYSDASYQETPGSQAVWLRRVVKKSVYLDPNADTSVEPSIDPNSTNPGGVWSYNSAVTDPFGNDTVYRYGLNGCPNNCAAAWNQVLVTSVRVFQGLASTGVLLRTHKTRYTANPHDYEAGRNIAVAAEWTVFHDEQEKAVGTRRSNLGRFGHFGTVFEFDFASESTTDEIPNLGFRRQSVFTYDEVDPNNQTKPNDAARWKYWFVSKLDSVVTLDGAGSPLRKATWNYVNDGRPLRQTAFFDANGSDPNAAENIVTEYSYDPNNGILLRSHVHKAGAQTPAYGSRFEYDRNVLLTKSFTLNSSDPNTSAFSYSSTNLVRDPSSGIVKSTTTPSGSQIDSHFDILGRPTSIVPVTDPNENALVIEYRSIRETWVTQGNASSSDYVRTKYIYDTLGRLVEVRRRTEKGCEALQRTTFDIVGRQTHVSEWGFDPNSSCPASQLATASQIFDPDRGTRYFYTIGSSSPPVYDALGRLQKVTTADGKSTTTSYAGATSTVTVQEVDDGRPSSTAYKYDGLGNLLQIDAPEGADRRFIYDAVNRLIKVESVSSFEAVSPTIQTRIFEFDGLGRLKGTTNPENGTALFIKYDAAGRVLEKLASDGTKFSFTYDSAGRPTGSSAAADITDPNTITSLEGRVYGPAHYLTQSFYDEAGVAGGAGRLTRTDSYDETGALTSRRKFKYAGLNQRLSEDSVTFAEWDGREGVQSTSDKELKTCYFYNDLGLVKTMRYPADAACAESTAPSGVARLIYGYSNGLLNSVQDANRVFENDPNRPAHLVKSVVYSAGGGVRQITYGNNRATYTRPDEMTRPESISVLIDPNGPIDPNGVADPNNLLFTTGHYAYDGAGNITSIGPGSDPNMDVFRYDLISRLWSSSVSYWYSSGVPQTETQTYEYDPFGNLVARTGSAGSASMPADPNSNRLTASEGKSCSYDQRGNYLGNYLESGQTWTPKKGYAFDERNRLLAARNEIGTAPVGQYAYDSGGERIIKKRPATNDRTFYVRDAGGHVLSEFKLPPAKRDEYYQKDYFYALGRVVGMAEESAPAPVEGFYGAGSWDEEFGEIYLFWTAHAETGISYKVFKKAGTGGAWSQVGSTLPPGTTTFSLSVTSGPPALYFRVAAINTSTNLEGIPSRTLKFSVGSTITPSAPTGLSIQTRERSLTLRWQRSSDDLGYSGSLSDPYTDHQGYHVYRYSEGVGWIQLSLLPLTEPLFHDLDVVPGQEYMYQVTALGTHGQSDGSITSSGTPGDYDPPAPPSGVRALSGRKAGEVTVVWNASQETDLHSYRVYQKQVDGSFTLVASIAGNLPREQTIGNLATQQSHTFAVAAVDTSDFYSAMSATATARPRVAIPATPLNQSANRFLSFAGNSPYVNVRWNAISGSPPYSVYRKTESQTWSEYQSVYTHESAPDYSDLGVDACRAYTYMARAVDPNTGDESADPNTEVFSERLLRPNTPTRTINGSTLTLNWGGFVDCQAGVDGFVVESWTIKTVSNGEFQNITIADPNITSHTFPVIPGPTYPFAIVATVRNLYHSADPNDPLRTFQTFISEDICTTTTTPDLGEQACTDLAGNDPPTGQLTAPDPNLPGLSVSPHQHLLSSLDLPNEHINHVIASANTSNQRLGALQQEFLVATDDSPSAGMFPKEISVDVSPIREQVCRSSVQPAIFPQVSRDVSVSPCQPTESVAQGINSMDNHSGSISSHRIIGSPSPKQFRFTFFHSDHLGSVRMTTDSNGTIVAKTKFLPFGEELLGSGVPSNTHRFTGHERDSETGADYMHARYYSPGLARFASNDPIQGDNGFAYVNGNPVTTTDPLGLYGVPGGIKTGDTINPGTPGTIGWDDRPIWFGYGGLGSCGPVCSSAGSTGSGVGGFESTEMKEGEEDEHAPTPKESDWIADELQAIKDQLSPQALQYLKLFGYDKTVVDAAAGNMHFWHGTGDNPGMTIPFSNQVWFEQDLIGSSYFKNAFIHELGHYVFNSTPSMWLMQPIDAYTMRTIVSEVPLGVLLWDTKGGLIYPSGYALHVYQYGSAY